MSAAKLLVVDDDPLVRNVIADFLCDRGHDVVQAANGPDALSILSTRESFDLLLVDYAMPGLMGDEVARRAREISPDLKVAFLTGYGDFLTLTGRVGENTLLNKTGRPRDLANAVEALLHETPGPALKSANERHA